MTNKLSRRITSFTFTMRKAYRRVVTAKPSFYILAIIVAATSIFLLGGGIYNLLVQPPLALSSSGGVTYFYYPGLNDQLLPEGLVAMILFAVGFIGFLMAYQSTRYAYKPRQAYTWLLTGTMFIAVAYIYTEFIIITKLTTSG